MLRRCKGMKNKASLIKKIFPEYSNSHNSDRKTNDFLYLKSTSKSWGYPVRPRVNRSALLLRRHRSLNNNIRNVQTYNIIEKFMSKILTLLRKTSKFSDRTLLHKLDARDWDGRKHDCSFREVRVSVPDKSL